jgi:hypothetical protein
MFRCPHNGVNITTQTCLNLQETWAAGERVACAGRHCHLYTCDIDNSEAARREWIEQHCGVRQLLMKEKTP